MKTVLGKSSIAAVAAVLALLPLVACTSGPQGTYSDQAGSVVLELKSGDKANFTFMGQIGDCTYTTTTSGKQIALNCKGEAGTTVFNIHDDGSLTGPAGSFMPVLRKQK